ncbi:hypothetical protein BB559_001296 [Furculomyces boomerangus]|uniref:Late endosomal/lysosomal adaptor and MAPK and MTOR activator 5 n=2 Tax=Harpellales TaxID=61421 RepID=A0A2T9Z2G0_9FUNG|nr:hypothetical protein BB559_001296 [Furculomyces boomerangus]PWA01795.1 hypothetical protein BB558_002083 [Smittium angustum]
MEENLENIISQIIHDDPSVLGVMIVDNTGLCLTKWGKIEESMAGYIYSIAHRAESILPEHVPEEVIPTIIVETEKVQVFYT